MATNHYIENLYTQFQPAQKWLKDRKERELSYDNVLHYQKIVVGLMKEEIKTVKGA